MMMKMKMKTIMKVQACSTRKYIAIFLILAVAVSIFMLHIEILQFQHEVNSTIIVPRVTTEPEMRHGLCKLQPLPPKEAQEERLLLDSIAWPETPILPDPLILEQTSDPAHSTFTILPGREGGQWHVGDQLEVMIKMSDFKGRPKKTGGDLLFARVHNPTLAAGVVGHVVDHLNGSYSAVMSLLWEGSAQVEVKLVHPSEAITVLTRLNIEQPDRMQFHSVFRQGSRSETTKCSICLRQPQLPLCNFTDAYMGEPWFCYKPKNLSCDTRIIHGMKRVSPKIKANEEKLFQNGINMKVLIHASGPASVTVLPKKEGQPEMKSSIETPGLYGYYYQGVWRALDGTTVRQFDVSAKIQCLTKKEVLMFGDSTIRMWIKYLTETLPDLKEFALHNLGKDGTHMSLDQVNNIMVASHYHGVPMNYPAVPISELRYASSEIDRLLGGPNTVVVIGVWAHFGTFPVEVYIRRLQNIRKALVRLLNRAPDTKVLIRTGNPKALTLSYALTNSDWYTLQNDKVLRAMFKGLNVRMMYAWEMVIAHQLPHDLHPPPPIIENMIDVLLSYVCPQQGS